MMGRAGAAFRRRLLEKGAWELWVTALGELPSDPAVRAKFELEPGPYTFLEGFGGATWPAVWSWDNPSCHGGTKPGTRQALLERMGMAAAERFPLPVRSSDLHQLVEHTHARLVAAFEKWYHYDPQPYDLRDYKAKLEHLFYNDPTVASPGVIMENMKHLPETCRQVKAARGGKIPKKWR